MRNMIFLLLFSYSLSGQNLKYDELKAEFERLSTESKFDSAIVVAKNIIFLTYQSQGDTSLWYADGYRLIGNSFFGMKLIDSASIYWQKSIQILEKQNRQETIEAAGCLNGLGVFYKKNKDYKLAETYYKQSLSIYIKNFGDSHLDVAKSYINLGRLYEENKDYSSAEIMFLKGLEIRKQKLGELNAEYALNLNQIGVLYLRKGNLKNSLKFLLNTKEIYENIGMESIADYAYCLDNLGAVYSKMDNNDTAKIYYQKSFDLRKKMFGTEHPDYGKSVYNLGNFYLRICEYKMAKKCFDEALEIFKKTLGENHPDYAVVLNNIGLLYFEMGDYQAAIPYYSKSLEIKIKSLGDEHPSVAASLNNFGILYMKMGDYKSAEINYQKSLRMRKKILGENHYDYARTLSNLGILYMNLGDFKIAHQYYLQAYEIRKRSLGEEHPEFASSLINLGKLHQIKGDYSLTENYFRAAIEIRNKILGDEHPEFAISLNNLGELYALLKKFDLAEITLGRAYEVIKKIQGDVHPNTAMVAYNFANMYLAKGDHIKAELFYQKALEIRKKNTGEKNPVYLNTLDSYAALLFFTEREIEAFEIINNNFKTRAKLISDNFEWLNDNQKEAYWKNESLFYDKISFYTSKIYDRIPEFIGLNYDAALLSKSKLLEAKISSENYYREVDEIREELSYRRRLIAKMESEGTDELGKLETLRTEADSLDQRLLLSWPEYAAQKKNLSITWNQVQASLDDAEAAIEFVRFFNDADSNYYYSALVIRKSDKYPQFVKLCKENDLLSISPENGYSSFYTLVWNPLSMLLKDIKTIYYAPTGLLNNVPFHAIFTNEKKEVEATSLKTEKRGSIKEESSTRIEGNVQYLFDKYKLHQLTSTRYLAMGLKQKEKVPVVKTLIMVGGVNYDFLPGVKSDPTKSKKEKGTNRSSSSASGKLSFLEGTKIEVNEISQKLSELLWQTQVFDFDKATEENITKLEGKEAKGILHIATHGYSFSEFDFTDSMINENSLRYSYRFSSNPMVRSGLILAGGNWAWTGSDTLSKLGAEQNGILTALEVSQLNLKNTKLVVLSACETGLGEIEGSEGTFGLKRGFKLAGVEQMIVSLWSVPDKETKELMTLFYTELSKSLNPVNSFEKAQKEMRLKYPTEPSKWAGFVLVR